MKFIIKITLLFLLLFFNLFGIYESYQERFVSRNIISKEVTLFDKYSIGNGKGGDSDYMKGLDDNGDVTLIVGDEYNIGDRITVYINTNSMQAQSESDPEQWHTSIAKADMSSFIGIVVFVIFTIINILLIIVTINSQIKKGRVNKMNNCIYRNSVTPGQY